jgi:hypothetical protein
VKTFENMSLSCFLIFFAFSISCCCDSSIEKYEPKNQDEKNISLLIQYQDAKNHFDIKRLLSLLHEKGEFSFQCGLMVSKGMGTPGNGTSAINRMGDKIKVWQRLLKIHITSGAEGI